MIMEGISSSVLQFARRGVAQPVDSARFNAPSGAAVDNLKQNQEVENVGNSSVEEDKVNLSLRGNAQSKPPAVPEESQVQKEDVKQEESVINKMVQEMNQKLDRSNLHLRFGTDEESGLRYFQLYDKENGDVIKQFPPEGMLEMAAQLKDLTGIIFNENV
jgi:flagellar protein FlaG